MTVIGWLQILVFFAAHRRGDEAARRLHVPRLRGRARSRCRACSAGSSGCVYRLSGVDPTQRADLERVHVRAARLQRLRRARHLPDPAPAARAAVQPAALRRRRARRSAFNTAASFTTNTNWQGVLGRVDDELPHPDGGPRLAQLHVGGGRHRRGARARRAASRAGPGPDGAEDARQLLGRPRPRHRLRAPAAQHRLRAGARLAGRDPEPVALPRRHDARGRQADARARPGGVAGGDQAARHQRRRLLQRQRRPPVREPDAAHELPRRCS